MPETTWKEFESQTAPELCRKLLQLAARVKVAKIRNHPRKAKKKRKKGYVPGKVARRHV